MELRGIRSKHPHIHNQPTEPNTKILIPCTQSIKCKEPTESVEGKTTVTGPNKEGKMREPVALPPLKKSRMQTKEITDPHAFSQKNVMVENANKQLLDSFSQQGKSIEIFQSALASERVPYLIHNKFLLHKVSSYTLRKN